MSREQEFTKYLDDAVLEKKEVIRITADYPELSIPEAYSIQNSGIQLRYGRGEKMIGLKMGLTSKAKMKQMDVEFPICGVLTNTMKVDDNQKIDLKNYIHPKIEPEIVFLVEREIRGDVSAEVALDACSGVAAGMEIIDSRFKNFEFKLPDVIADNCSSSGFVLGKTLKKPQELDLGNLGMFLEVNGKPVQFGSSSAIYDHPAESLAELSRILSQYGKFIPAHSIVLSGAATQAIPLEPGNEYKTTVQDLGSVTVLT